MKIYSDTLTGRDIGSALLATGLYAEQSKPLRNTRVRKHGWNVLLGRAGSSRHYATGTRGASAEIGAASWDDWGRFLAYLYGRDPDMRAGPYQDRASFEVATNGKYRRVS